MQLVTVGNSIVVLFCYFLSLYCAAYTSHFFSVRADKQSINRARNDLLLLGFAIGIGPVHPVRLDMVCNAAEVLFGMQLEEPLDTEKVQFCNCAVE